MCLKCGKQFGEEWLPEVLEAGVYPTCDHCGGILKPNVVLFEEMLPANAWMKAQILCEQADLILVVGSSLEVYPANMLPENGLRRGAKLIINTISRTHLDNLADVVIHADLIDTIPAICSYILK